jgi:SH3 domain protein
MKRIFFLITCLVFVCPGLANAAYITDKLLAGMYSKADGSGNPIQLLTSGTPIELLEEVNGYVKVKLVDGKEGWVEKSFVSNEKPANARLLALQSKHRQLQEQLDAALKGQKATGGSAVKPVSQTASQAEIRRLKASESSLKEALDKETKRLVDAKSKLDEAIQANKTAGSEASAKSAAKVKQLSKSESELKASLKGESARLQVLQNKYKLVEQKLATTLKNQKKIIEGASASSLVADARTEVDALNETNAELKILLLNSKDQLIQLADRERVSEVNLARLENEKAELEGLSGDEISWQKLPWGLAIILLLIALAGIIGGARWGIKYQDKKQLRRHGGFRI